MLRSAYCETELIKHFHFHLSFRCGQFMISFNDTRGWQQFHQTPSQLPSLLLLSVILICFLSFLSTRVPVGLELLKRPLKAGLAGSSSGFADDESCSPKGLVPLSWLSLVCPLGLFISVIVLKSKRCKEITTIIIA